MLHQFYPLNHRLYYIVLQVNCSALVETVTSSNVFFNSHSWSWQVVANRATENKRMCQISGLKSGPGRLNIWGVVADEGVYEIVFNWETKRLI